MSDPEPPSTTSPAQPRPPRFRGPRAQRAAALLMVALIFLAGVGADRFVLNGGQHAGASSSLTATKQFDTLQQTWDLIHDDYVDVQAIDDPQLIYAAAGAMVDALGDTGHSRFLDPQQAKEFDQETRGQFTGVGIEIVIKDNRPLVVAPLDETPADKAGIRSGDVILAINGTDTAGVSIDDISRMVRGKAGTQVTLTLQHAGQATPYTVTLTRATITIKPVTWAMLPNHVADVRLSQFSVGTTSDLKAALTDAQAQGAKAWILDLRNNPGGLVSEAIGVASAFMPEGETIFETKGRNGEPKTTKTFGQPVAPDMPMVVLVNNGSASAAEIVAAALRDDGRAYMIGETTFGTGTVLTPFPLQDGSVLLLGTSLWLTPQGKQVWKKGVQPNETVSLGTAEPLRPKDLKDLTAPAVLKSSDIQLAAAFARLTGAPSPVGTPAATPAATPVGGG